MAIHLHRSNRSEALVGRLCEVLDATRPDDPFRSSAVVVGSRGMERWLRHEIATRSQIAAGLAFPFPREALAGAARWLLDGAKDHRAEFWRVEDQARRAARRWERDTLAFELVGRIRDRIGQTEFHRVGEYLEQREPEVVGPRELLFASEVADVLDRLMHDRPELALAWAATPDDAPEEHRWLATLLADLDVGERAESPALLHRQLLASPPAKTGRTLCVFGLSTMGPGDRARLSAIARSVDVHLFVLVPTDQWFHHQRTRIEAKAARRAATTDTARDETERELGADNPVLSSLAAPSRDLQDWLEDVGYLGDTLTAQAPASSGQGTLLEQLQSWILSADSFAGAGDPWVRDTSIGFHSTYGALRQCEVLRDQLLALFAADPTLEPRDVLVMTPDIETYAPLVSAVFSRTPPAERPSAADARLPRIPVAISDLGLRRTNPVAEVLISLLEFGGERVTATRVLDFLTLDPVRRRWGLDDDDVGDLRRLVRESGFRWGMDAADRASVEQPALDQNTARFALERLALGVLMPADELVVAGADEGYRPALPLAIESQDRVHRVGRFAAIMRVLSAHREALRAPGAPASWRSRLVSALDDLAATSDEAGWLRAEVDGALDDMATAGGHIGDLKVDRAAVLRWLRGQFEIAQRGDRAITGAVQVSALEPMRSVPFRVIALLGMDDGSFPRGSRPRTWDPMQNRERGERDRRETDRHLMLEAILSVRDHFLILWSGRDVHQGKEQPAAVPVEELLEMLGRLTGSNRDQLVQTHTLQPWSAGNFVEPAMSFDRSMAVAAARLRAIAAGESDPGVLGLGASGEDLLPEESQVPEVLSIDELANALLAPHRLLLQERLGLSVHRGREILEDREPIELGELDRWSLRARMVDALVDGGGTDTHALAGEMVGRLAAEGVLPLEAGGRLVLETEAERARQMIENLESVAGELHADGLELSLQIDAGAQLVGRASTVRERDGELLLQWGTPSSAPNERLQLIGWLHLLVARAAGAAVAGARLVGSGPREAKSRPAGQMLIFAGTPDDARTMLADLVMVWRQARRRPIPLFRRTSSTVGAVLVRHEGNADAARLQLIEKATQAWFGSKRVHGDVEDPWISTFFVDYNPVDHLVDVSDDGLLGLAARVWSPLHEGMALGRQAAGTWLAEGGS